jgi:hypothetical protein
MLRLPDGIAFLVCYWDAAENTRSESRPLVAVARLPRAENRGPVPSGPGHRASRGLPHPGFRAQKSAQRNRLDREVDPRVPVASTTAIKGSEDSSFERRTALRPLPEPPTGPSTFHFPRFAFLAPVQRSLPIREPSRRSLTVSVETAGLVFDLAGPSGQDEMYVLPAAPDSGLSTSLRRRGGDFAGLSTCYQHG